MRLKQVPRLQRHVKTIFSLSLFVVFISIIFLACQKGVDKPSEEIFDAANAKEWYYEIFKKSPEWASSTEKGKKLPNWKKGIYKKIGNIELVEFPLVKAKTSFAIPSNANLTNVERQKIANASLNRIVFIKKGNEINVREVNYVAEWEYLNEKGFDISNTSLLEINNDFSGRAVIKKWNGSIVSINILSKGKVIAKAKKDNTPPNSAMSRANSTTDGCFVEYCVWQQDCTVKIYGDGMVENECTPWYNTGECFTENTCLPNDCEGLDSEQCACKMYGICGDDGGGEEEEENACKRTLE